MLVVEEIMDMAEEGRAKGKGEAEPVGPGDVQVREEGCCLTAKTKVLFTANLAHCGCTT